MQDKLIREAETAINTAEVKQATEELKEFMPSIAKLAMETYKSFIEEGFNEIQAFDFAKEYVLRMLLPGRSD
mgnify:CR=1 FL=1